MFPYVSEYPNDNNFVHWNPHFCKMKDINTNPSESKENEASIGKILTCNNIGVSNTPLFWYKRHKWGAQNIKDFFVIMDINIPGRDIDAELKQIFNAKTQKKKKVRLTNVKNVECTCACFML